MKSLTGKMAVTIVILGGIEAAVAAFFSFGTSVGVLIGTSGSVVNLLSLWYDINRSVKRRRPIRGYAGRYVFNAVLMLLGGLISLGALIGVFIGLMNLKLSAYLVGWRG